MTFEASFDENCVRFQAESTRVWQDNLQVKRAPIKKYRERTFLLINYK